MLTTTAEKIADNFTKHGAGDVLDAKRIAALKYVSDCSWSDTLGARSNGDGVVYEFADGSAIVVGASSWEVVEC